MSPDSPRNAALTLCLITDRRRLTAAVGEPLGSWRGVLRDQIQGAVEGGVDIVQIRESDVPAGELVRFVQDCVALVAGTAAQVIVNDRADVAMAAGAHGVHLRERSIGVADARRLLARGCTVGRSVHTPEAAATSRSADYLIAGSVFETDSKPGQPARLGLEGLSEVVKAAGDCPVWAIGGVTPDRIGAVLEQGATGVSAIGAFIASVPRRDLTATVRKLTATLRFSFDSPAGLS